MKPLPAAQALDQFFLDARARLLDLAAILDRIDRGEGSPSDPRLTRIHEAIRAIQEKGPGRAAAVQRIFSLEYDESWPKPKPRF
jgi:hypothetical protein